jgi:hypothetical protein
MIRIHVAALGMCRWLAVIGVFAILDSHNVYSVVGFEAKEHSPVSNAEPESFLRVIDEFLNITGPFATKRAKAFRMTRASSLSIRRRSALAESVNVNRFNEDLTR